MELWMELWMQLWMELLAIFEGSTLMLETLVSFIFMKKLLCLMNKKHTTNMSWSTVHYQ
jgi:hypothetical protein